MTAHDAINAVFEGGGAIFLCLNVRRLLKDRSVKGVSLLTTSWWTAWGFWNVYFYRAVGTPASFYAGIAVVLVNAVWLGLAVYYARRPEPASPPCPDVVGRFPEGGCTPLWRELSWQFGDEAANRMCAKLSADVHEHGLIRNCRGWS